MLGKVLMRNYLAAIRGKAVLFEIGAGFCLLFFFSFTISKVHAAIVATDNVSPSNPANWTSNTTGYIGDSATGTVTVDGGSSLLSYTGYLGHDSSSSGTVTVTGAGSQWTYSRYLYLGYKGNGTLNIEAGGLVNSFDFGYLGYSSGSTGTAKVSGSGSKWINTSGFYVGMSGNGMLNIEAGGEVSNSNCYLGYYAGSTGAATVTGVGSKWTNSGRLYVGNEGSGTLTVTNGGTVIVNGGLFASLNKLFGNGTISTKGTVLDADLIFDAAHDVNQSIAFGSGGTLNLTQDGSGVIGAGFRSNGTLRIADGRQVPSSGGYLGYQLISSSGTATVTGPGSTWSSTRSMYVGYQGSGTLNIEAGGLVNNTLDSYLGYLTNSTGTARVTGTGSKWINNGVLYVGYKGIATLNIDADCEVSDTTGYLGLSSGSTGTVTVNGSGSKWTNSSSLYAISGTLNIEAGGQVSNNNGYLGNQFGSEPGLHSLGTAKVTGVGSIWANNGYLYVGRGILNIEAGGQVSDITGYLGYSNNTSTATVTGNGSKWTNSVKLYLGDSDNGTLNIGTGSASGGLVAAKTLTLATTSTGIGNCNINGGTLQAGTINRGSGVANFNWIDGTIRNYDAMSDLTISNNLVLKLAATGAHAFNIDLNRIGTIDAVLSDATSGGSLKKIGVGMLELTAVNTYSGGTVVEEGRFKVTGSILNTSGITVKESAILDLANTTGSATAANLAINNAGTILISAGSQKVGTITGTGITQINTGASLTAQSIVQNTLSIGGTGTGASMSAVPEPSTLALLDIGAIGLIAWAWRRSRKAI